MKRLWQLFKFTSIESAMKSNFLLIACLLIASHYASAQFVFKDEKESQRGLQFAYVGGSALYAQGKDIGAVFSVGAGLETGITYAIAKNLHISPRGYLHYFSNTPEEANYNDNLWLWNFGGSVSYQIALGDSEFNLSPVLSFGYKGASDVITFPYSGQERFTFMKMKGLDVSTGVIIEKNSYFVRLSYEIYQNNYDLDEGYIPNNVPRPPSKPYGPVYTPGTNKLNMNYMSITFGYQFDFFL